MSKTTKAPRPRWWEARKGTSARKAVVGVYEDLDQLQALIAQKMATNLGLVENRTITNLDMAAASWGSSLSDSKPKENVIRAAATSAKAKISTNRPRPFFQTNGADWSLRKQAKQRQLFADAVLYRTNAYAKARRAFMDGLIWPVGILKTIADAKRQEVRLERVLRHEVAVDPIDARYGEPRSMFQHKVIGRSMLLRAFGDSEATAKAGLIRRLRQQEGSPIDEPVSVVEAWHLPSGPGAKDGRHLICTPMGDPLLDEPWRRERFPLVLWRWSEAGVGWDGVPMIDELIPYQQQIDELSLRLRVMMRQMTLRMLVPKGGKINLEQLNNDDEIPICEFTGPQPPVAVPDGSPPAALFAERDRQWAKAFAQVGLSDLLSQSEKPVGLDSGKAIREYKDTESERFEDVGQAFEELFCGPEGLVVALEDAADDLLDAKVNLELFGAQGRSLHPTRWSDARRSRESMRLQVMPSSFLPTTPAGQMATIQEMAAVSPMASQMLLGELDSPDVEAAVGVLTAPFRAIMADLDAIEELGPKDEFVRPDPLIDLQLAKTLALARYLRAKEAGAPEWVLDAFRSYLLDIRGYEKENAQRDAPPAPPPGAQPGAGGLPPELAGLMPPGGPGGMPPGMPELPPGMPPPGVM
jgi:hypothetical protein